VREQRFALGWDHPYLPGASTHVSLFDGPRDPLHVVASGHGKDEASALGDLLSALRDGADSAAAIAYVSDQYAVIGNAPARSRR
jgi:hypothetical protein